MWATIEKLRMRARLIAIQSSTPRRATRPARTLHRAAGAGRGEGPATTRAAALVPLLNFSTLRVSVLAGEGSRDPPPQPAPAARRLAPVYARDGVLDVSSSCIGLLAARFGVAGRACRGQFGILAWAGMVAWGSRTVPGPMWAWGPIVTWEGRMQSRSVAWGPTVTWSQRMAPVMWAWSAMRESSPITAMGPTWAPAPISTRSPITDGAVNCTPGARRAVGATQQPPRSWPGGGSDERTRPASRSIWASRYAAGLPMSRQ